MCGLVNRLVRAHSSGRVASCCSRGVHLLAVYSSSDTKVAHVEQRDHDLHNLDPNLLLRQVVQDLYGTCQTQEICAIRACRLYGPHPAK